MQHIKIVEIGRIQPNVKTPESEKVRHLNPAHVHHFSDAYRENAQDTVQLFIPSDIDYLHVVTKEVGIKIDNETSFEVLQNSPEVRRFGIYPKASLYRVEEAKHHAHDPNSIFAKEEMKKFLDAYGEEQSDICLVLTRGGKIFELNGDVVLSGEGDRWRDVTAYQKKLCRARPLPL